MKPATIHNHQQLPSNPSSPDSRFRDSRFATSDLDPETQSQILDLFIAGQMDLASIAALCNITFTQLIDFLESPRIIARLDAIQRLCERRAALMAAEARCVALARLRSIADHQPEVGYTPAKLFTRELETIRKAAAQLLRLNPHPRGEVSGTAGRRGSSRFATSRFRCAGSTPPSIPRPELNLAYSHPSNEERGLAPAARESAECERRPVGNRPHRLEAGPTNPAAPQDTACAMATPPAGLRPTGTLPWAVALTRPVGQEYS